MELKRAKKLIAQWPSASDLDPSVLKYIFNTNPLQIALKEASKYYPLASSIDCRNVYLNPYRQQLREATCDERISDGSLAILVKLYTSTQGDPNTTYYNVNSPIPKMLRMCDLCYRLIPTDSKFCKNHDPRGKDSSYRTSHSFHYDEDMPKPKHIKRLIFQESDPKLSANENGERKESAKMEARRQFKNAKRSNSKAQKIYDQINKFELMKAISSKDPVSAADSIKKHLPLTARLVEGIPTWTWEVFIMSVFIRLDVVDKKLLEAAIARADEHPGLLVWHEVEMRAPKAGRPFSEESRKIWKMNLSGMKPAEIAKATGKTPQNINGILRRLEKKFGQYMDNTLWESLSK